MLWPALVPELYVSELSRSLRFYLDLIGFELAYERPEEGFAALRLGEAGLMLEQTRGLGAATTAELAAGQWRTASLEPPFGRGINLELLVPDVAAIHARLVAAAHPCLLSPHDKTYRVGEGARRVRRMLLADPDGYLLRPTQPLAD